MTKMNTFTHIPKKLGHNLGYRRVSSVKGCHQLGSLLRKLKLSKNCFTRSPKTHGDSMVITEPKQLVIRKVTIDMVKGRKVRIVFEERRRKRIVEGFAVMVIADVTEHCARLAYRNYLISIHPGTQIALTPNVCDQLRGCVEEIADEVLDIYELLEGTI